ncbi:MAG: CRISPR-associated endonuclease Cas1 [Desulfobacter postgatei]|uniref:CRISPR-associated endonuclease Cas1 n=1 Tax=Desulfobacter postgatei TaxID=2293 RepID=UPI0023F27EC6|nr:CRISPR-associated endonuclease Cas1 [Desulfobacter postgatei]MDD4273325.1 CRISPR-associated endonuclease Cas1 [Desulfobacter postgatei]
MDKMTVVLDNRHLTVRLDGKALRIDGPDRPMQRIPMGMISQVIVYGNIPVETSVWRVLSENGVPAVLFPSRGKGEPAWLGPGISTSVMVRISQFRAWSDRLQRRKTVTWLLDGKLYGMRSLLDTIEIQGEHEEKIRFFLKDCQTQVSPDKSTDSLRGIEGIAAKQWFSFMSGVLPGKWQFSGRNRRPPMDPVNALLSLGYTLLVSEIRKSVHARGLDPCIGFLHAPYPGRESLVLDLAEPLRPGVDAFVLALTNGLMEPADFTNTRTEGCRILKDGRGVFYNAWEEWKEQWPFSIVRQDEKQSESSWTLQYTCTRCIEELTKLWERES